MTGALTQELPSRALRRLALVVSMFGLACSAPQNTAPRAVVIGIDSADWGVIDELVAEGRMPHLQALRARGTSGALQTLADIPLSPVIWTSVATGKIPAKHGITWFLVDQPDGQRVPVRSYNRRAKALWNILADAGRSVAVVGWWASYPAEDVGAGVIASDALGFHGFGRTARSGEDIRKTHPPHRFAELDALVPPEQQIATEFAQRFLHLTDAEYHAERYDPARHARHDPGNPIHLFQQYAATAQGYTAIAEKLLGESHDLMLVYYEQVDSFSHLFMKHAPPKLDWIPQADFDRYRDAVHEWYAYQDELLGRLLAQIDPETTAVFVVSDHGFKSGERRIRSEEAVDLRTAHLDHEPEGIFLATGPGIRDGAELVGASVLDLAPTLLHYLGLAVAKDMDGRVLTEIFEPGFGAAEPPTYLTSYEADTPPIAAAPPEPYDEAGLANALAGLEALGYVQGGGEAPTQELAESDGEEASSPEIHNNLGRIHARAGEFDEAVAEFEKALALNPHDADALLNLATIAAARGNRVQAEHLAKVAVATNPDFPPALAQLADLRREAGDLDDATRLYAQAIALNDAAPGLYLGYGDCLQRTGRLEEAEAAFNRALELEPDSVAAVFNLGVTAFQQGREEQAIIYYERALEMDPMHPLAAAAYNNLGTVHFDRGEVDSAVARWEQAVAASPAQLEAHYNLASRYLAGGRVEAAVPLLEQAARLAPNHEAVHVQLARAYMETGRGEEAYRALSLVRRLYPENWFAPLGMAVLFAGTDREEQARPLLEEALRLGENVARAEAAGYPALASLLSAESEPAQAAR